MVDSASRLDYDNLVRLRRESPGYYIDAALRQESTTIAPVPIRASFQNPRRDCHIHVRVWGCDPLPRALSVLGGTKGTWVPLKTARFNDRGCAIVIGVGEFDTEYLMLRCEGDEQAAFRSRACIVAPGIPVHQSEWPGFANGIELLDDSEVQGDRHVIGPAIPHRGCRILFLVGVIDGALCDYSGAGRFRIQTAWADAPMFWGETNDCGFASNTKGLMVGQYELYGGSHFASECNTSSFENYIRWVYSPGNLYGRPRFRVMVLRDKRDG